MVVLSRHSLSTLARTEENAYSPKYHGESSHSRKGVHSGSLGFTRVHSGSLGFTKFDGCGDVQHPEAHPEAHPELTSS